MSNSNDGTLIDGVARNRNAPRTFSIPPRERRVNLKAGAKVKIGLTAPGRGERFWVRIVKAAPAVPFITEWHTGTDSQPYLARITDPPVEFPDRKVGDLIAFEARHVLDIAP